MFKADTSIYIVEYPSLKPVLQMQTQDTEFLYSRKQQSSPFKCDCQSLSGCHSDETFCTAASNSKSIALNFLRTCRLPVEQKKEQNLRVLMRFFTDRLISIRTTFFLLYYKYEVLLPCSKIVSIIILSVKPLIGLAKKSCAVQANRLIK